MTSAASHGAPVSISFMSKISFALLQLLVISVSAYVHGKRDDVSFDYVVVGGGTAGLTLAARLTEDLTTTVAVIEAGSFYEVTNPLLASTPAGDVVFAGSSRYDTNPLADWDFVTVPQAGAKGREIRYPRGQCLGGSSASNFMIYQRPDKGSLQMWADAVDDQSYTWDNMLQWYKKSAHFTPPNTSLRASNATAKYTESAFDASAGPLQVSYANYAGPFSSYIQSSLDEIGVPVTQDFNSGSLMGSQYCSSTINPTNANRDSSQTSFLNNATQERSNLHVMKSTMVSKVLFDSSKRATGVSLTSGDTVKANKEVILSAGAFNTPQVLMLSGIGPAATLSQFGIPIIADRPGVGQNMTDHFFAGPTFRVNVETFTKLANDLAYITDEFFDNFLLKQQGVLTNPVCDYLGWEKAPRSGSDGISSEAAAVLDKLPASWPDIEYLSAPGYVGDFSSLLTTQPDDGYQYATIFMAPVAPQSRGTVTISSSNASDLPVIDPAWLTDPTDVAVSVAAYKRLRAAFATNAMKPALADPVEYFPGPSVQGDDAILDTIRNTLMTVYHASCTARMGRVDDPTAVVDSNARVIGVSGLRVVDASSFALLPPGHPQSTVYAFAEKIAAQIIAGQ